METIDLSKCEILIPLLQKMTELKNISEWFIDNQNYDEEVGFWEDSLGASSGLFYFLDEAAEKINILIAHEIISTYYYGITPRIIEKLKNYKKENKERD